MSAAAGVKLQFQRAYTNDAGAFQFVLPAGGYAHVTLFARGLLKHLFTRVYLTERSVPSHIPVPRRATLVAQPAGEEFRWDVRLRGEGETVFFEPQ